jgi:hypothetical protein
MAAFAAGVLAAFRMLMMSFSVALRLVSNCVSSNWVYVFQIREQKRKCPLTVPGEWALISKLRI